MLIRLQVQVFSLSHKCYKLLMQAVSTRTNVEDREVLTDLNEFTVE